MSITRSRIPGFDVAVSAHARCALGGGDYHAVFEPKGRASIAVAVGDVAGHDALAARLVAVAGDLLGRHDPAPGRLGGLMDDVNQRLTPHMLAGRFMTLFLAVMVAEDRSIHWVSAGHGPVLAYDPLGDRFDEVAGLDIPLGIDAAWRYRELDHVGWADGALLVAGTDGIWESRAPGGAMYGKRRLMERVRHARAGGAADIVAAVEADIAAFRAERAPVDDTTLMVVKAVQP